MGGCPGRSPTGSTVVVNRVNDLPDLDPGDGICDANPTAGDQCTLRAAIEELNAQKPGSTPGQIEFDLAGSGPFTITTASALPAISVPVVIDGASQPGASCPTSNSPAALLIVLDGSNAGTSATGLILDTGSDGSTIRGLVIGNFTDYGIRMYSNDNNVRCNHMGLGADGVSLMGNDGHGVLIHGDGNTIGGQVAYAQRNVISGNGDQGVRIESADNNRIANNFIGTTADGMGALGNGEGIHVFGTGNSIGSDSPLARNVISSNGGFGIRVNSSENNLIRGNYIGVARDGVTPLPNYNGVEVTGDSSANVIGGPAVGEANLIANNGGHGVLIDDNVTGVPVQNSIRGNAIYGNAGLGIDLGDDGVDSNDPGDGDGGENERQNYPVLATTPGSQAITGTLDSQANTQYTVDLYRNDECDPSGYGEGQEYLLELSVTTNGSGHADFTADLTGLVSPGNSITATATDPNGNTSEFSACAAVTLPPPPPPSNWVYLPAIQR